LRHKIAAAEQARQPIVVSKRNCSNHIFHIHEFHGNGIFLDVCTFESFLPGQEDPNLETKRDILAQKVISLRTK